MTVKPILSTNRKLNPQRVLFNQLKVLFHWLENFWLKNLKILRLESLHKFLWCSSLFDFTQIPNVGLYLVWRSRIFSLQNDSKGTLPYFCRPRKLTYIYVYASCSWFCKAFSLEKLTWLPFSHHKIGKSFRSMHMSWHFCLHCFKVWWL